MQVKKKYELFANFIFLLNNLDDADELVNINENKFNILKDFAFNIYQYIDPNELNLSVDVPENVITSTIRNLNIELVNNVPNNPNENTLYLVK